jgi:hypothetical protein
MREPRELFAQLLSAIRNTDKISGEAIEEACDEVKEMRNEAVRRPRQLNASRART